MLLVYLLIKITQCALSFIFSKSHDLSNQEVTVVMVEVM